MHDLIAEVWDGVPPIFTQAAKTAMARTSATDWCSGCSGTDSPAWPLHELKEHTDIQLRHSVAAERDEDKACWSIGAQRAMDRA